MTSCVSARAERPFILLWHVENWLDHWLREALDASRDAEVMELSSAQDEVRRTMCGLLQSERYGGPLAPETRRFMRGIMQLQRVDEYLTRWLAEARAKGSSESVVLWTARRTVRSLSSEVIESWRQSRRERNR
jgi:hypothetical protein